MPVIVRLTALRIATAIAAVSAESHPVAALPLGHGLVALATLAFALAFAVPAERVWTLAAFAAVQTSAFDAGGRLRCRAANFLGLGQLALAYPPSAAVGVPMAPDGFDLFLGGVGVAAEIDAGCFRL